jgi:hypothetical protein
MKSVAESASYKMIILRVGRNDSLFAVLNYRELPAFPKEHIANREQIGYIVFNPNSAAILWRLPFVLSRIPS